MKQRDENQVKGRWGEKIISMVLPDYWVVRDTPDDFGIDIEIEPFYRNPEGKEGKYRTHGEHLLAQVKTTDIEDGSLSYQCDVPTLMLAESMGASVPMLLFYVDRATKNVYYLCLTDYVRKVLDADQPTWRDQGTVALRIPVQNHLRIGASDAECQEHWVYINQLARRGKFYSAFNELRIFADEFHALVDAVSVHNGASEFSHHALKLHRALEVNLTYIERLDIWTMESVGLGFVNSSIDILAWIRREYHYRRTDLIEERFEPMSDRQWLEFEWGYRSKLTRISSLIDSLAASGKIYEEIVRRSRVTTAGL